jgi:hypothetical protein
MTREPDDAKGARGPAVPIERPGELGELGFPNEADTLTTHGPLRTLPRRDTTPVPSIVPAPAQSDLEIEALADEDILDEDIVEGLEGLRFDDDTQVQSRHQLSDDVTSPTLSLANQSDAAREVYRMFLASEYAPALALADELIAQGMYDPMLVTIARECRSSIAALSSSPPSSSPPPPLLNDGARRPLLAQGSLALRANVPIHTHAGGGLAGMFDAHTTIAEIASMTGTSVEQVVALLERFVTVLPARPPR